jgi:hypothetical protein
MQALQNLGQVAPTATVLTTLYTVPGATTAAVSTINVANTSGTADIFSISVAVAGAADNIKQYLYYTIPIPGNNTFQTTLGLTMAATDVIRVYSANGTCSFSAWGALNT